MTTDQPTLPLTDDDREAHAVYLDTPPLRASEPRPPLYWRGLMVDLRIGAKVAAQTREAR